MTPTLCIYHGGCADGFSAAWAVHIRFGDGVLFHPGVYGEAPPDAIGADVLLVDFSYKKSVLEEMSRTAKTITVLDHHKTAQADLEAFAVLNPCDCHDIDQVIAATQPGLGNIRAIFNMEKSGAVLAWEFCHAGTPVPDLLLHVQDRDLWRFEIPHTREIQACVFSHPQDFGTWGWLADRCGCSATKKELIVEGAAIERTHAKDVASLIKVTRRSMIIGDTEVPVANLPHSMAFDAAGEMAREVAFAACYYDKPGARVFSLRSRRDGGADVSAIAARYGGGGHKNAAGFSAPAGWEGEAA